jgi:hypothetical protein
MLVTNHVICGATLGSLIASPPLAFAAGVGSHFVLDALPHWGVSEGEDFLEVAVRDGLTGLAAIAVLAALSSPGRRWSVLGGMAGAAFPDLDKPARLFFGRSPFPRSVDRFHAVIQREAPHRMRQEVATAVIGAALAAVSVRRRLVTG